MLRYPLFIVQAIVLPPSPLCLHLGLASLRDCVRRAEEGVLLVAGRT